MQKLYGSKTGNLMSTKSLAKVVVLVMLAVAIIPAEAQDEITLNEIISVDAKIKEYLLDGNTLIDSQGVKGNIILKADFNPELDPMFQKYQQYVFMTPSIMKKLRQAGFSDDQIKSRMHTRLNAIREIPGLESAAKKVQDVQEDQDVQEVQEVQENQHSADIKKYKEEYNRIPGNNLKDETKRENANPGSGHTFDRIPSHHTKDSPLNVNPNAAKNKKSTFDYPKKGTDNAGNANDVDLLA